ncbi:XshC-Cox1-family protein [Saccharothrix sp. ALI-22-I]|uniref:XdhC family protein n=1 Tax=Saccharothrix sp. ALI-22-I TaxID=1933778 RepID=UPI00097C434C|nr:XdhC family protein [Saccharothrix sp. ALI-22-I]ONI91132.1 XshC-Cox1-family protein [Saccharothrix sp. ALI-22-I]
MLELVEDLTAWRREGRRFAVATVVSVSGSAPRPPGAALAVDDRGEVVGTVSGGCVEGAVYELCREALATGEPVVHRFGWSDDSAFAVGLTCGGAIEVFVHPTPLLPDAAHHLLLARIVTGPPGTPGRTMTVRDGATSGTLGDPALDDEVTACRTTQVVRTVDRRTGAPIEVMVEVAAPPPRLLVFGALDFAAALSDVGNLLGYRVTVCDPRPVFATDRRFPSAEVVVDWPHRYLERTEVDERTAVCVLTHDPKFDIPVLTTALRMPLAYVGAMGSRRTHRERTRLLVEAGVTQAQLARLRSPLGLDLGARTPEETALSIAAEIVAHRHQATGLPLTDLTGPIHACVPPAAPTTALVQSFPSMTC